MKNIFLALALIFTTFTFAQDSYQPHNEGWKVRFDKAVEESHKTGKPILANFTGSDWCGWCTRLTRDVFSKEDFKKWADKNVVLLELDFPRRKQMPDEIRQQNYSLKNAFQVSGFPTIWVFYTKQDENGNFNIDPVTSLGYQKSSKEFTGFIDKFLQARKDKK